jgi:APA family basic amino acid/polyamine antiporter
MFNFDFSYNKDYTSGTQTFMDVATPNISLIIFWLSAILLALFAFIKKFSLIPLMGVITCMYLLTGMSKSNWLWFIGWLVLGIIIYFLYGYKNSKLAEPQV